MSNQRLLKFRVWDVKLKQFLPKKCMHGLCLEENFALNFNGELACLCAPRERDEFIIQQFTGLLDIKNKEIFEGDILTGRSKNWNYDVYFNNGSFRINFNNEGVRLSQGSISDIKLSIVGNICENPEIIKQSTTTE